MPRIPIFRLGGAPDKAPLPELAAGAPSLSLEGLSVGVDNLRHDVLLSGRFADAARAQIGRSIARYGEVDGLLSAEASQSPAGPSWLRSKTGSAPPPKNDPAEWDKVRIAAGEYLAK